MVEIAQDPDVAWVPDHSYKFAGARSGKVTVPPDAAGRTVPGNRLIYLISPVSGLDGSAPSRRGMRPAR